MNLILGDGLSLPWYLNMSESILPGLPGDEYRR